MRFNLIMNSGQKVTVDNKEYKTIKEFVTGSFNNKRGKVDWMGGGTEKLFVSTNNIETITMEEIKNE